MRYCCMFEIMTIHMHKLVKISGIVTALKSPKQLCSAQCCLSSAETKWRSNHELALLCLSRHSSPDQECRASWTLRFDVNKHVLVLLVHLYTSNEFHIRDLFAFSRDDVTLIAALLHE